MELYGYAASAGFLVFQAGSERYVFARSEGMWHEVRSVVMKEVTPSNSEHEAAIFRHFQDNANSYIASRSKVSKAKLDAKIKFREWWMTGTEMVEFGFADGLLGQ